MQTNRIGITKHFFAILCITDAEGKLLAEFSYGARGRMRDPETWALNPAGFQNPQGLALLNGRGYTAHEMLPQFGIINMNGRLYDPVLGRMLSPDNYIQAPDYTQNFNRYSYVLNNPLKYTDPSGEWVHLAIGATIGGIKGMIIAHQQGYEIGDWQFWAYSVAGSTIGAGIAFGAYGLSTAGVSSALIGAAAGAGGGASYTALAGGTGEDIAWNGFVGGVSGFVGGAVGSATATGYGSGPFLGGFAASITTQLMNGEGDFEKLMESAFIDGMMSVGLYYTQSSLSYMANKPNVYGRTLSFDQYLRINAAYQRSRFWHKEYGVYLNNDGTARFVSYKDRHKLSVDFNNWKTGDFASVHTHWAKEGVDWVNIGGTGRYKRYRSGTMYPAGSYKVTTVGGYHSDGDMNSLPNLSIVVGRTTSTAYIKGATSYTYIAPDPFLRFFIYDW